jgi:hemoglobin-like flavoprotein
MTPGQKNLVRKSFIKILPISDCVATLFVIRLFELDPELKQLFDTIVEFQEHEFREVIAAAIIALEDFESALPEIERLGQRCARYNIKNRHYDSVGQALLWSLEQGLDREFTPAIKEAWMVMYALLSGAMKAAAAEVAA